MIMTSSVWLFLALKIFNFHSKVFITVYLARNCTFSICITSNDAKLSWDPTLRRGCKNQKLIQYLCKLNHFNFPLDLEPSIDAQVRQYRYRCAMENNSDITCSRRKWMRMAYCHRNRTQHTLFKLWLERVAYTSHEFSYWGRKSNPRYGENNKANRTHNS